jgi:hypothetical protein
MAFSPECPKADSHIVPMMLQLQLPKIIHDNRTSFKCGLMIFPTKRPKERPTTETSTCVLILYAQNLF